MKYTSTRNNSKEFNFSEVFIKGLAEDGGLFIPKTVPKLSNEELQRFGKLNYQDLAKEIIFLFCNETIKKNELSNIIDKSYLKFREKNVVKIVNVGKNKLLELFHGPTLAFKDIAMQFIGNLYDYQLKNTEKKINVVVATSGDTVTISYTITDPTDSTSGCSGVQKLEFYVSDLSSPATLEVDSTSCSHSGTTQLTTTGYSDGEIVIYIKAYDLSYGYDIATVVHHGLKDMYEKNNDCIYYITVENENYKHPPFQNYMSEENIAKINMLKKPLFVSVLIF